jgi:hypothetical protein
MRTVPVTEQMVQHYSTPMERAVARVFKDAPEMETEPCEAVVHRDTEDGKTAVVTVPWQPSAEDLAALADGAVIMLSTWGGLPAHRLDVVPGIPVRVPDQVPIPPVAEEPSPGVGLVIVPDIQEEDR